MIKKIKIIILFILTITLGVITFFILKPTAKLKEYENESIKFQYSGHYKFKEKADYWELSSNDSNIIFEMRKLNSVENNASFESLVDNIIYNYQKQNQNTNLISEYSDYKFNNDLSGYRLVFENKTLKINTLMLIVLENLDLLVLTMNANQEEFEFLTDSAELMINSLSFKEKYEYLEVQTKYPTTKDLTLEAKVSNKLELANETKEYSFNQSGYEFKLLIPTNFLPKTINYGGLTFVDENDTTIKYEFNALNFQYDQTKQYYSPYYKELSVIYGYTTYNNKIYYVIKHQYNYFDEWYETIEIHDLISYSESLKITIKTKQHVEDHEIETILKNVSYKYGIKGINNLVDNQIEGTLIRVEEDYNSSNLIGSTILEVNYKLPNKNCKNSQSIFDTFRLFFCDNIDVEYNILNVSSSFNDESLQKFDSYSNYKYKYVETLNINNNLFKHYKETYNYTFASNSKLIEKHYFILTLTKKNQLVVIIESDLDNLNIQDYLNLRVKQYEYKLD